jgi:hypothetical protein
MRSRPLFALAPLLVARSAAAQPAPAPATPPPAAPAPPIACAGQASLDAFDAALRGSVDPELHRDRAACLDRLGFAAPAISDYRFYVTHRPDAADADGVRARIEELEKQVGQVKAGMSGVSSTEGADVTVSSGGATEAPPAAGASGQSTQERRDQLGREAASSPLRAGKGFVLGLAVGGRDFTSSGYGAGEILGLDARYSFTGSSAAILELTVGHVAGANSQSTLSGPGILGGYELRVPLTERTADALLLGVTFRFESYARSGGFTYTFLEPEGRAGYRHVFGPAFGIEAVLDGGPAFTSLNGVSGSSVTQGLIGGHVGVLLGF